MASGTNVPVGRHQFPMRVLIPEDAPSSYESEFGSIRYTIKVALKANSEQVFELYIGETLPGNI